jgi:hypothetical protein
VSTKKLLPLAKPETLKGHYAKKSKGKGLRRTNKKCFPLLIKKVFLACKGNANIGLTGKCFRFSISLQNRLK